MSSSCITFGDRLRMAFLDLQTEIEFSRPVRVLSAAFAPEPKKVEKSVATKTSSAEKTSDSKSVNSAKVENVSKAEDEMAKAAAESAKKAVEDIKKNTETSEQKNHEKEIASSIEVMEKVPVDESIDVKEAAADMLAAVIQIYRCTLARAMSGGNKEVEDNIVKIFESCIGGEISEDVAVALVSDIAKKFMTTEVVETEGKEVEETTEIEKEEKTEKIPYEEIPIEKPPVQIIDSAPAQPAVQESAPVQQPEKEIASANPVLSDPNFVANLPKYVMPLQNIMDLNKAIEEDSSIQQTPVVQPPQVPTVANGYYDPIQRIFNPYPEFLARSQAQQQVIENPNPGAAPKKERPVVAKPGLHKEDAPQKPIIPKEDPDAVVIEAPSELQVKVEPKAPKVIPDIIETDIGDAEPIKIEENRFDNSAITENRWYLKQIEKIANENNIHIKMEPQIDVISGKPTGIIEFHAYNGDNVFPNPEKSFAIDTGHIINKEPKMYPTIKSCGYEDEQKYYPVFYDTKKGSKARRKQLDKDMFYKWFKGGVHLMDRKPMHSSMYSTINGFVDLITTPEFSTSHTKHQEPGKPLNSTTVHRKQKEQRVWELLVKAYKEDVFKKAYNIDPGSRFRFEEYHEDPSGRIYGFTLTNEGVPMYLGGPIESSKIIKIKFEFDGTNMIRQMVV